MPDAFGNITPDEASALVRQQFAEQRAAFARTPLAQSEGGQVGQALGNIFGGFIRKSRDTSAARKSEAQRLVEETGMSPQEARSAAKESIPRDFREVRQAKIVKEAGVSAQELIAQLTPEVGPALAQAAGMVLMAGEMRKLGFADRATELTLQAAQIRQDESTRLRSIEQVKVGIAAQRESILASESAREARGETSFTKLVNKAEELRASIDTNDDPAQAESLERQLGRVESQISKLNTVVGTQPDDPSALSRAGRNKQATELFELNVLGDKLDTLEASLVENKGTFAATFFGRMSAGALGFLEDTVGFEIGTDEQLFLDAVADIGGGAAFVSAQIRHSLTGAAMSPAEAVFLEPFLAQPGDSLSQMLAKVRVVAKYTQLDLATRQEMLDNSRAGRVFFVEAERQARAEIKSELKTFRAQQSGTAVSAVDATAGAADAEALRAVESALSALED